MFHQPHNSRGNFNFNAFIYSSTGYKDHFHRNFEVIFLLEGQVDITINGELHHLHPGDLALIAPWEIHSFTVDEKSRLWVGVFSKDFISKFAHKEEGRQFAPFRCDAEAEEFLRTHLFREEEPPRYLLMACLYLICDQCLKHAKEKEHSEQSALRNLILHYVDEHYTEQITLQQAAEVLGYEYHYFSRLFHDCFEMNFRAFINIYRFDLASEMLSETEKEISDIAMESGFQSLRNFNRIFKTLSGNTPQDYRTATKRAPRIPYRKE